MGEPSERVLVVPRATIVPGEGWLGVRRDGIKAALEAVGRDGRFVLRSEAEEDPTHKQVIPYLVLRDG
ncbi:MAG: phosphoesterase, partial [Candidatus Limnocylindrales bacterium]